MIDIGPELRCYGGVQVEGGKALRGKLISPVIDPSSGRYAVSTAQGTYTGYEDESPTLLVHSFVEGHDVLVSFIVTKRPEGTEAVFYRLPGWSFTQFAIDAGYRLKETPARNWGNTGARSLDMDGILPKQVNP
jgi:hypothetical protein